MNANTKSGIYRLRLGGGSFYIGSAVDISRREQEHRVMLRNEKHCNRRMQNCWNKYGVFESEILELCATTALIKLEQYYLNIYFDNPKNLNICSVAGSTAGFRPNAAAREKMADANRRRPPISDETRKKMRASQLRRLPVSDESRANMSEAQKGRVISDTHKQKLRDAAKRRPPVSDATKEKLTAAGKGRKPSDETREKMSLSNKAYRARAALIQETDERAA